MKQPEALELADLFDRGGTNNALHRAAAAELRRLHQAETENKERILRVEGALVKCCQANQELVEALEMMTDRFRDTEGYYGSYEQEALDVAHAALNKARGIE